MLRDSDLIERIAAKHVIALDDDRRVAGVTTDSESARRTGMLPDHLNPRVRLRDWLNKPSRAEREAAQERAESGNFSTISARHTVVIDPDDGKIIGTATDSESAERLISARRAASQRPSESQQGPDSCSGRPGPPSSGGALR